MERTQIYLSKDEMAELDRRARASGTTRSHLIREAIRERYLGRATDDEWAASLRAATGAWTDRSPEHADVVHLGRGLGYKVADLLGEQAPKGSGTSD